MKVFALLTIILLVTVMASGCVQQEAAQDSGEGPRPVPSPTPIPVPNPGDIDNIAPRHPNMSDQPAPLVPGA